MHKILIKSAVIILPFLTGCVSHPGYHSNYSRTITGSAIGATGGALLGHAADRDKGVYIGSAAGALIGGAIGYSMDRQSSYRKPQYSYDDGHTHANEYEYDNCSYPHRRRRYQRY